MDGFNFDGLDYVQCNNIIREIKRSNDLKEKELDIAKERQDAELLAYIGQVTADMDAGEIRKFARIMSPILSKYDIDLFKV
jgi:hypothetical protein